MDNILIYLRQIAPSLTKNEATIANYLTDHPKEVPNMKISELAVKTNTSLSSITRFCKKTGLPGFPELKMEIAKTLYQSENNGLNLNLSIANDIDLRQAPDMPVVIKNVITTATNSFSLLGNLINSDMVKRTVELIRKAPRTLIVGIGASGLVGLDLYQKLLRLGINATYNAETHLQMVSASTLKKDDLAIVISYSGETTEIISITKRAKSMGASVVGITRIGNTSLHRLADYCLLVPNTENICRNGAFISRLDQLLINDMIFYTFLSQYYEDYQEQIDRTWQGVFSISSKINSQES